MKLSSVLSYIRDTGFVDLVGTILMIIAISGLVLCGIGVVYVVVKQSNSPVIELRKMNGLAPIHVHEWKYNS